MLSQMIPNINPIHHLRLCLKQSEPTLTNFCTKQIKILKQSFVNKQNTNRINQVQVFINLINLKKTVLLICLDYKNVLDRTQLKQPLAQVYINHLLFFKFQKNNHFIFLLIRKHKDLLSLFHKIISQALVLMRMLQILSLNILMEQHHL